MKNTHIIFYSIILILLLFQMEVSAGNTTIQWEMNTESDLKGYRIYKGSSSRRYGPPINVGKVTRHTINDLDEGKTYFFSVTAIDSSGNESGFSEEIARTIGSSSNTEGSIVNPVPDIIKFKESVLIASTNKNVSISDSENLSKYVYYLPLFIENTDQNTIVGLRNIHFSGNANISIVVYDESGSRIASTNKIIEPRHQISFHMKNVYSQNGWIRINSDQPLTGFCFVASRTNDYTADVNLMSRLSTRLFISDVRQGPVYDTTILVCNPNNTESKFTFIFTDNENFILSKKDYIIPSKGSGKFNVNDWMPNSEQSINGKIEIIATKRIAAYALCDNKKSGGHFFKGIEAINSVDD